MASVELGPLAPFPVSEAEFPSFPEDIIPGHDYRLNVAAIATYVQAIPASQIDKIHNDKRLERLLDIHLSPLIGTLVVFTARYALFNTYEDAHTDATPTPQKCIPGPLIMTSILRDYGIQNEVTIGQGTWEPGDYADFFLLFAASNDDTEEDGYLWVPHKALEAHSILAFDPDNLN